MADQLFVCGGSGKLSKAAQVELMDFARHLQTHPRGEVVDGCRFCAERAARAAHSPTSTPTGESNG